MNWQSEAATAAKKAVPNQAFQSMAAQMAASTPFALDYILQAPVLVCAACAGKGVSGVPERSLILRIFVDRVARRPKLRDLMAAYDVAYPFRALKSTAVTKKSYNVVRLLSVPGAIHPSALVQAIPDGVRDQQRWIAATLMWFNQLSLRVGSPIRIPPGAMEWGAFAAGKAVRAERDVDFMADLADFYFAERKTFNPNWSYQQARAAMERWHNQRSEKDREAYAKLFESKFRVGFEQEFSYGLGPKEHAIGGLTVVALNSGRALFDEGAAMRHCVASYAGDVIRGDVGIFSIRSSDRRLATLEVLFVKNRYRIAQIKGPCNSRPEPAEVEAAQAFVDLLNEENGLFRPDIIRAIKEGFS